MDKRKIDKKRKRISGIAAATALALIGITGISIELEKSRGGEEQRHAEIFQEETKLESVLEEMRPALVTLRGSEDEVTYTVGSGFILEMREDKIFICTNRHVIEEYENWEIGFFDGTTVEGVKVGTSQVYDVGIVKLELNQIPQQLLNSLFAVNVDLEYWSGLYGRQTDVGFVSMYQEEDKDKYVTGLLVSTLTDFFWDNELRQSEFQMKYVDGDSGSAIFDESGHLISMVYGTSYGNETEGPRRWGVPLSAIVTCYMEITAESLSQ